MKPTAFGNGAGAAATPQDASTETEMEIAQLLGVHTHFVRWRRRKAVALAMVERIFEPQHPLRVAVGNALCGDPLACCTLLADNFSCQVCDQIGDEQFGKHSGGMACTQLFLSLIHI